MPCVRRRAALRPLRSARLPEGGWRHLWVQDGLCWVGLLRVGGGGNRVVSFARPRAARLHCTGREAGCRWPLSAALARETMERRVTGLHEEVCEPRRQNPLPREAQVRLW